MGLSLAGSNCNKIPRAMFDPTVNPAVDPSGLAMMKLYPQPNVINPNTITNFSNVPVRSLDENEFDVRIDHTFSNKDSVFGRFSYDQATSFVPGGSPGFAEANAFGSTSDTSPIMAATWRSQRPTFSVAGISTSSLLAITESSITSGRLVTELARRPTSASWAQTSTASARMPQRGLRRSPPKTA